MEHRFCLCLSPNILSYSQSSRGTEIFVVTRLRVEMINKVTLRHTPFDMKRGRENLLSNRLIFLDQNVIQESHESYIMR